MKVISAWSNMESFLSGLFVQMLGANPTPAAAMFNALTSTAAQTAALRALAQVALSKARDRELFEALLAVLKQVGKPRNAIAHWVWGHASSLPDAVLLCDPRALITNRIELDAYIETRRQMLPTDPPRIPDSKIQVWYADDFRDAAKHIDELSGYLLDFSFMLRPAPSGE